MLPRLSTNEKILLLFLAVRPAIDAFRDVVVFSYRDTAMNVNAGLSIIFAIWSAATLILYRKKIPRRWPVALAGALVFFSFASALWSVAPATTIVESLKLFNAAAIFLLAFLFVREKRLTHDELAITIAVSAAIPMLAGLLQLFSGGGIATFDVRGRIYGTLAHPNVFAFLLVALMILWYEYRKKILPRARLLPLSLLALLLLFTYTRAAYASALLFFLIIGWVRARKTVLNIIAVVGVLLALAIPVNRFLTEHFDTDLTRLAVIERVATRNDDADSFSWRLSLVRETVPIIHKRPVLGYGYGTFTEVWEDNRGIQHLYDDSAEAHNDYLRLALELGLVGLLVYTVLLLTLLFHARKNLNLFAWVFVCIIASLSENMLHHTPVLWLTAAWWGAALQKK